MDANHLLSSIRGWNILLAGFAKTGVTKSMYTVLDDIAGCGLKPTLDTFKILVDSLCTLDNYYTYTLAIFDFWREFSKNYPALEPDIEFINKLLHCCRRCNNMDRAFFFLGIVEQCKLKPNLATFQELLLVSVVCVPITHNSENNAT